MHRAAWALTFMLGCSASPCTPNTEVQPGIGGQLTTVAQPPAWTPRVEFAGCMATTAEPAACSIRGGETEVHLWVEGNTVPLLRVDELPASGTLFPAADGSGWTAIVTPPPGSRQLSVRTAEDAPEVWRLAFSEAPATPIVDGVRKRFAQAREAGQTPDLAGAVATLTDLPEGTSSFEAATCALSATRFLFQKGDHARAIEVGNAGLAQALDAGEVSAGIDIAQMLSFLYDASGRRANARWLSDVVKLYAPAVADARQRATAAFNRGKLARTQRDLGEAYEALTESADISMRLGLVEHELSAAALRTPLLAMFGREDENTAAIARVLALIGGRARAQACEDAAYLSAAGWALVVTGLRPASGLDGEAVLKRALALYGPDGCPLSRNPLAQLDHDATQLNYAFEAIVRHNAADLRDRLQKLQPASSHPEPMRTYVSYAEGELALLDNSPRVAVAALASLSTDGIDPVIAWRIPIARGHAYRAAGTPDLALRSFLEAEERVDAAIDAMGIDQGREGLAAAFSEGSIRAVELQLAAGDHAAALQTARRSRARVLRPILATAALADASPEARRLWRTHIDAYAKASAALEQGLSAAWSLPADQRARLMDALGAHREAMRDSLEQAYRALRDYRRADRSYDPPGPRALAFHAPAQPRMGRVRPIRRWFGDPRPRITPPTRRSRRTCAGAPRTIFCRHR